ncbi:hypothetical protein AVEN_117837-1 [Araneus ventricosus]|uniref:Uncharacterized protein n=1 Tax=Araneus ventricosus TaxID=182803 RepID=A0A4Y2NI21_ARAVE|nr:hypothetical protein AVEN_117837-1 [Araneus ventricosus]
MAHLHTKAQLTFSKAQRPFNKVDGLIFNKAWSNLQQKHSADLQLCQAWLTFQQGMAHLPTKHSAPSRHGAPFNKARHSAPFNKAWSTFARYMIHLSTRHGLHLPPKMAHLSTDIHLLQHQYSAPFNKAWLTFQQGMAPSSNKEWLSDSIRYMHLQQA